MADIVEGSGRPQRREAAGNRKRFRPGDPVPAWSFGQHGELTPRVIAKLSGEEKRRAQEIYQVQGAYLSILDCLDTLIDPAGTIHDLSAIMPTKLAVAYTLAMAGFRRTGNAYIKKQDVGGRGVWVDARAPDTPPPPQRAAPEQTVEGWHIEPKITVEHVEREQQ